MIKKLKIDLEVNFGTDAEEFKQYVGRYPKDKGELEDFAHYIRKGIDAQLDWDMINRCAADNFR